MRKLLAVCGTALFGCSDPMDSASLTFAAEPVHAVPVREWGVARTEGGNHEITVRHTTRTSFSCEDLAAELMHHGRDFTVRVRGSGEPRPAGAVAGCRYTAVIAGIPSGRYGLRVVHSGIESGAKAKDVLNQPIHIP